MKFSINFASLFLIPLLLGSNASIANTNAANSLFNQLDQDWIRAQWHLKKFDQLVDEGTVAEELFTSKVYSNLQALHVRLEETSEQLAELGYSFIKNAEEFRKFENELTGARLSHPYQKWVRDNSTRMLRAREGFIKSTWKLEKDYDFKYETKMENELSFVPLDAELEELSKDFQNEFRSVFLSSKSDILIEPSSEANGNVTGNRFPKGTWSVTWDDGPHKSNTQKIIEGLEEISRESSIPIKGDFFTLVPLALTYPEVSKMKLAHGMGVQDHSFNHYDLTRSGMSKHWDKEIIESADVLESHYSAFCDNGVKIRPTFFRLPYGAGLHHKTIRDKIAKASMIHAFWNVDTLDWQDRNPARIFLRTKKQIESHNRKNRGGLILFHDIHQTTITGSLDTVRYLVNSGNNVWRLDRVVAAVNGVAYVETQCNIKTN